MNNDSRESKRTLSLLIRIGRKLPWLKWRIVSGGVHSHSSLQVRRATANDAGEISKLFFNTVRTINARDYNSEQILAWAPHLEPDVYWLQRWNGCLVWVAEDCSSNTAALLIVGFTELRQDGEIDCFYVHHRYQGVGVGRVLMNQVLDHARKHNFKFLYANVCITAKTFFEKMGFQIIKKQTRQLRCQEFEQYHMQLSLEEPDGNNLEISWHNE